MTQPNRDPYPTEPHTLNNNWPAVRKKAYAHHVIITILMHTSQWANIFQTDDAVMHQLQVFKKRICQSILVTKLHTRHVFFAHLPLQTHDPTQPTKNTNFRPIPDPTQPNARTTLVYTKKKYSCLVYTIYIMNTDNRQLYAEMIDI